MSGRGGVVAPAAAVPPEALEQRPDPGRLLWADVAKGVCILLVVLWHVIAKQYLAVPWKVGFGIQGAWGHLGEAFLPLRMPLFFSVSGMLALGALNRPWGRLLRFKTARFEYLYLVWLAIHTAVFAFTPGFETRRAHDPVGFLAQLSVTPSNLWYLYALALYFPLAKATRRLPAAAVLGPALLLSAVASADWIPTPGDRGGLLQNVFFFLLGARFGPDLARLAETSGRRRTALLGAGFVLAYVVTLVLGGQQWFGVWPVLSVLAMLAGVSGAAVLARRPCLARPLAGLGRRTLPIYVLHLPLLALLHTVSRHRLASAAPLHPVLAVLDPLLVTALLVAACLGLHHGLQRAGARWLFELPGPGAPGRGLTRRGRTARPGTR